jgi:2-iminobutanoate/2-iminopropanoate deaminase
MTSKASVPRPGRPFSKAIRVGNLVFTHGQGSIDPQTGRPPEGGIKEETKMALDRFQALLAEVGASLGDVVKVTVYLRDWSDQPGFDQVYASYFKQDPPVRTIVRPLGLPHNMLLEMDMVAIIGEDEE